MVVGWAASHPADPIRGAFVSDRYFDPPPPGDAPWAVAEGALHPANLEARLAELRLHPGELEGAELAPFVPALAEIDQRQDRRLSLVATALAETLGLAGDFGHAAANIDDDGHRKVWTFGATVTVPIFDGWRAGANRGAALSRQRVQQARLNSLELQISSELRLARQDASSRFAQITVAEKNARLAEEQLRLARSRYNEGVADNREIIEAQTQLAVAADNFLEAVYQYNLSRVELARAKGDVRAVLAEKAQ